MKLPDGTKDASQGSGHKRSSRHGFPGVPLTGELATRPDRGAPVATVLVADDDPALRRATQRALESRGYEVLVAGDGQAALELFRNHRARITLVISDLEMPKLGGMELTEALREEGATVSVLITSGHTEGPGTGDGASAGRTSFLQKPWTLEELFARVDQLRRA